MQLMRYQYTNHLGTATLELTDKADVISYEEYYPYSSTSFQSGRTGAEVGLKRYRYIGKERDEETGFYYMGARYYASWICRWIAVDPINTEKYNIAIEIEVTSSIFFQPLFLLFPDVVRALICLPEPYLLFDHLSDPTPRQQDFYRPVFSLRP